MSKAKKASPVYLQQKSIIVQPINGKNDINGNPNRIWRIYDAKMSYLGWIDDGYSGRNFQLGRKVKELVTIYASPRQYKDGQEFQNEGTIESQILHEKREIQAYKNKILRFEGLTEERKRVWVEQEITLCMLSQIKFHKQKTKNLRAKLKALKNING